MDQANHEVTGKKYSFASALAAREYSISAVNDIAIQILPGMTEHEAQIIADQVLIDRGMERYWHPTKIRFGKNTLKTFREPSDPKTILGKNDLFFIDIGPVFNGHEGDYGDTFTTGNNLLMQEGCVVARRVFKQTQFLWENHKLSGEALYCHAEQLAKKSGWQLNLKTRGHRLSDFPHAIYKAPRLQEYQHCPSNNLWVLEIQIAHPTEPFGAFFEDLLIDSES